MGMRHFGIGFASLLLAAASAHAAPTPDTSYSVRKQCGRLARCFPTIQAALDASAHADPAAWVSIDVGPGTFHEKIVLTRNRTRLTGQGADRTRLEFDAVAETAGHFDRAGWGTAGSATLTIDGDEMVVRGLTIENSFDYLANDALSKGDPRKIDNSQGVALQLDMHSDRVLLDRVALVGNQDTLFTRGRRAWIRNSLVAGNIDFIFGNGMLLIEDSEIRTRRRAAPSPAGDFASFVAAPSTPLAQPYGLVFHRARLTREPGVADGSVALARPWHPTTVFADGRYADPNAVGQTSFIDCDLGPHIHPAHWTSMAGTARDGTKTALFRAEESRFSEEGSTGPGARSGGSAIAWKQRPRIDAVRAVMFEGWKPE